MEIINHIKSGAHPETKSTIFQSLIETYALKYNVKTIILGCTELPLIPIQLESVNFIDPMKVLANETIKQLDYKLNVND